MCLLIPFFLFIPLILWDRTRNGAVHPATRFSIGVFALIWSGQILFLALPGVWSGFAAHLPGMLASKTSVPVMGVPVRSSALSGLDSLLSIVQMPRGIPVATFAIGEAGAGNAGLSAAAILANDDPALCTRLDAWRGALADAVAERPVDETGQPVGGL